MQEFISFLCLDIGLWGHDAQKLWSFLKTICRDIKYYREEPSMMPCWICYFNFCFWLLLFTKGILSIHNGLPWKNLLLHLMLNQISFVQDLSISSLQFSHSVVSDSLWPHESQHTKPPCPSPTPGVHPDSRPLSQWCHPAISSSVVPFSSCPQSLPASKSFPMSQLFAWGGQNTGVSAWASFLPKNTRAGLL